MLERRYWFYRDAEHDYKSEGTPGGYGALLRYQCHAMMAHGGCYVVSVTVGIDARLLC